MIGNDIVDLVFAKNESNWKRPRFLDKIFTPQEQKYIMESRQPEKMVWLFWSMKESAYKLHVQVHGKRFFAPKRLVCSLMDLNDKKCFGRVDCGDFQCVTQSEISDQYIYTVSKLKENDVFLSQTFVIENPNYNSQHKAVCQKAIARFAEFSGKAIQQISIRKEGEGIPFLWFKNQKQKFSFSMTHHGHYGSFAMTTI